MADLRKLLIEAADNPARRPDFFRALLMSNVYVLGSPDRPIVDGRTQPGTMLRLVTWTDDSGPFTPFFTSEEMLRQTVDRRPGTDPQFVRLAARDFLETVRGQRLVLDPDGEYGKFLMPAEVDAILDGQDPGRHEVMIKKGTTVFVGAAAHIPPELPRVLAEFFDGRGVVQQAHLGWIAYAETGEDGYLVVALADDRKAAMQGFEMLQITDITGGKTVDVYVVPRRQAQHFLSNVPPFYKRSSAGGKLRSLFGR
jgi:type III secretion system (T3SS) SseB-like protein